MQHKLLDMAANNNIRVLGPNTLGVVNNYHNFCTSFVDCINPIKPIGIICQTGTFYLGASDMYWQDPYRFREYHRYLRYRRDRPSGAGYPLKVINIHMESLQDGSKFEG